MMDIVLLGDSQNPWSLLAYKIVERAIYDWRGLCRGDAESAKKNYSEIRSFLTGVWCEDLLSFTDITGEWVLMRLENERKKERRHLITVCGVTKPIHTICKELGVCTNTAYYWYKTKGQEYTEQKLTDIKRRREKC